MLQVGRVQGRHQWAFQGQHASGRSDCPDMGVNGGSNRIRRGEELTWRQEHKSNVFYFFKWMHSTNSCGERAKMGRGLDRFGCGCPFWESVDTEQDQQKEGPNNTQTQVSMNIYPVTPRLAASDHKSNPGQEAFSLPPPLARVMIAAPLSSDFPPTKTTFLWRTRPSLARILFGACHGGSWASPLALASRRRVSVCVLAAVEEGSRGRSNGVSRLPRLLNAFRARFLSPAQRIESQNSCENPRQNFNFLSVFQPLK